MYCEYQRCVVSQQQLSALATVTVNVRPGAAALTPCFSFTHGKVTAVEVRHFFSCHRMPVRGCRAVNPFLNVNPVRCAW